MSMTSGYRLYIPRKHTDSISMMLFGSSWVNLLVGTMNDIDRVRSENGFNKPYPPEKGLARHYAPSEPG